MRTIVLALAAALLFASPCRSAQPPAASCAVDDVGEVVMRYLAARDEYVNAFRNLVAEETKTIEVFRASGEVEKRREIVSDLLVYSVARDGRDVATEYRDVRSVDGQAIDRRAERALKLITKAANAGSIAKELETINNETRRYEFRRHLRGFTINWGAIGKQWRGDVQVDRAGREQLAGSDVVVLVYRRTSPSPSTISLPPEFGTAKVHDQGRLWIDVHTCQLRRGVWELAAPHPDAAEPLVTIRADLNYRTSAFGILVPDRIVFDWMQRFTHPKNGPPSFGLSERMTFTYGTFKRFEVGTEEEVHLK